MASKEAREAAIKQATRIVNSGCPFTRRAGTLEFFEISLVPATPENIAAGTIPLMSDPSGDMISEGGPA